MFIKRTTRPTRRTELLDIPGLKVNIPTLRETQGLPGLKGRIDLPGDHGNQGDAGPGHGRKGKRGEKGTAGRAYGENDKHQLTASTRLQKLPTLTD